MDSQPGKTLICRHIKTNGHRCQACAIGSSAYCYFHLMLHRGHRAASAVKSAPLRPETVQYLLQNGQPLPQHDPPPALNFPPLEDPDAIQLAISLLFAALVAGHIEPNHARTLLYSLQIASFNVRSTSAASTAQQDRSTVVSRIVRNRHGQIIAAPGDNNGVPSQTERPKSLFARFLEENCYPAEAQNDPSTPSE
jgi:hypothetical protein